MNWTLCIYIVKCSEAFNRNDPENARGVARVIMDMSICCRSENESPANLPEEGYHLDRSAASSVYLPCAEVAELADARDSKSRSSGNVGSTPTFGTRRL